MANVPLPRADQRRQWPTQGAPQSPEVNRAVQEFAKDRSDPRSRENKREGSKKPRLSRGFSFHEENPTRPDWRRVGRSRDPRLACMRASGAPRSESKTAAVAKVR
jgi:hypothetical protein